MSPTIFSIALPKDYRDRSYADLPNRVSQVLPENRGKPKGKKQSRRYVQKPWPNAGRKRPKVAVPEIEGKRPNRMVPGKTKKGVSMCTGRVLLLRFKRKERRAWGLLVDSGNRKEKQELDAGVQ